MADFEFDAKDILNVRIDRRRKLPVTTFCALFMARNGKIYSGMPTKRPKLILFIGSGNEQRGNPRDVL